MRLAGSLAPRDGSPPEGVAARRPIDLPAVRLFASALGVLLLGYMFLGRGFAHLGFPPLYVGEVVLVIGIVAVGWALWRHGVRPAPSRIVWLLLGLMALGAVRTVPYVGTYGLDALRDAVLWGYALFALLVYALTDRAVVLRAFRVYGWVVPIFALWLPVSYNAFALLSRGVDPLRPGEVIPLIFFKGGDMAVHFVGAVGFLVLGATTVVSTWSVLARVAIGVPLIWTALVAGAANRGALLTMVIGVAVVVGLAPRSRNWLPLLLATAAFAVGLALEGALLRPDAAVSTPQPTSSPTPAALAPPTSGTSPSMTAPPTRPPGASPSGDPHTTPGAGPTAPASGAPSAGSTAVATGTPAVARPTPEPSGELVRVENPGFESGPPDGGVEGWTPHTAGTYAIISEGAHEGGRFVAVDNSGGPYEATLTSSRFPVAFGSDVQVSLWAKALRGRPSVEIYVTWYERSGRRVASDFLAGLETYGARAWKPVVGAFEVPPEAVRAEVVLWEAAGHAAVGLDELTVRAGDFVPAPPPPSNGETASIANADFERGPLDAGVEGWAPLGTGTFRIVATGGYRDTRFAEIDNMGGPYQATLTSNRFPFTAGDDIEVSLWAKAIRGNPMVEIYVNWYDLSGGRISSVFLGGLATDGVPVWNEVRAVLTAPSDAAHAEILLWEATGHATIGIDEVTVRAGDFIIEPPPPPDRRPATLQQLIENIFSVFGSSSDPDLEGTKQFRLAWWGTIVDYTVFGEHFWTGKGFGVNLADDDGFQSTADRSLRAPHNSHVTVLARMGVPGFALWLIIQVAVGVGLLHAIRSYRRAGDATLAAIAGWLLAYWVAMLVDTSFDPYLEGPQGGIWFWTIVGLGLVVMRIAPSRRVVA